MTNLVDRLSTGTKSHQRKDREDRTLDFRNFRRTFEGAPYVNDIDLVEWRMEGDTVVPVAVLELTRIDDNHHSGAYLQSILARFSSQGQGLFITQAADRLGCDAYIVAYYQDLTVYCLYNLSEKRGWRIVNPTDYQQWVRSLTPEAIRNKRRNRLTQR
jgi:hypothetical protein